MPGHVLFQGRSDKDGRQINAFVRVQKLGEEGGEILDHLALSTILSLYLSEITLNCFSASCL